MLRIWVYFTIIFLQQEIATSKVKKIILLHQSPDTDGISRYYSTQQNMNLQLQRKIEPEKKIIGDRYQNHTKLNQNIQISVEYVQKIFLISKILYYLINTQVPIRNIL